jgi:glutaconate CoA-transferase subunit B
VTTVGMVREGRSRQELDLPGQGPQAVITDLGILEPDADTGELVLTHLHPGVSTEAAIEATGWSLKVAKDLALTEEPSERELEILRGLVPSHDSNIAELIGAVAGTGR